MPVAEAERLVKGVNVLVVTPGRLLDHLQVRRVVWYTYHAAVTRFRCRFAPTSAVGIYVHSFWCSLVPVRLAHDSTVIPRVTASALLILGPFINVPFGHEREARVCTLRLCTMFVRPSRACRDLFSVANGPSVPHAPPRHASLPHPTPSHSVPSLPSRS